MEEGLGRRDMAWMQGFYFGHFDVPWGLKQDAIGPCGLLSVIQAYILKHLLFVHRLTLAHVTQEYINISLISALSDILLITKGEKIFICIPKDIESNISNITPKEEYLDISACMAYIIDSNTPNNIYS